MSDSRLRAVYDIRGKKGVDDDRAIIERTALPKELLEEYEKLKLLFEERTYVQDVSPQGLFQLTLDATPLVMGVEDGSPLVSVKNAYVQQSAKAKFSKYTTGDIVGTVFSTQRVLFTGIQCGLKHQLSNQNWYKVSGLVSPLPSLGFDFYHNLSNSMYMTSENIVQWSTKHGLGISFNGKLARKLNDNTTATVYVKDTGNSVGVSVEHQIKQNFTISSEIQIGYENSHLQISSKFQPNDQYVFKVSGRIGTAGPSATVSVDHNFAKLSQAGARILISYSSGIELRLRLIRATMNYVVKIHLSPVINIPAVLYASVFPLVLYGCIKVLALGPLIRQQKAKEMEEKKMEREKEMKERKREAEAAVELMKETVERIIFIEQGRHGLIIIEGWYGCLFSTQTSVNPMDPPKVIDVRIPLQCLVTDSKLMLRESSKCVVPGFYDPCVGEKKHLRVKYKFRDALHEVTVDNSESLIIPRQSHRLRVVEE